MINNFCKQCGLELEDSKNIGVIRKFCSEKCAHKFYYEEVKKERKKEYKKFPNHCPECGLKISFSKKKNGEKYCSKKCSKNAQKKQIKKWVHREHNKIMHKENAIAFKDLFPTSYLIQWFASKKTKYLLMH